jgi:hypothetical protein
MINTNEIGALLDIRETMYRLVERKKYFVFSIDLVHVCLSTCLSHTLLLFVSHSSSCR